MKGKKISRNRRSRRTPTLHLSSALARQCSAPDERALHSPEPAHQHDHQSVPSENSALRSPFTTADPVPPPNHTPPTLVDNDSCLPETVVTSNVHYQVDDTQMHVEVKDTEKDQDLPGSDVDYECVENGVVSGLDDASETHDGEISTESDAIPFNLEALSHVEVQEQQDIAVQDDEDASVPAASFDQEIITSTKLETIPSTGDAQPAATSSDSSRRGLCFSQDRNRAQALLKSLLRRFKPPSFTGIITLYGKARYTLEAYEHLVAIMKEYEALPSPTNMRQVVFPFLTKTCFATSGKVVCPSKNVMVSSFHESSAGASRSGGGETITPNKRNEAVVVLPSTWARLDIRSYHVLREIVCLQRCRCIATLGKEDIRIESTYRVRSKEMWKSQPFSLWVSHNGTPLQASVGSRLSLHTFGDINIPSFIRQRYKIKLVKELHRGQNCKTFQSDVFCTFMANHSSTLGVYLKEGLRPSEKETTAALFLESCMSYLISRSNSGSTDRITDRSSESKSEGDERQRTGRKHKHPSEGDCEDDNVDSKINPGDLVTFLTPVESCNKPFLIVYVNRFWPSRLDSDKQLILFLYNNDDGDVDSYSVPSFGVPSFLSHCKSTNQYGEGRTHENRCHTTGKLSSGERFYMYRLLLYADDFNPRSQLFPRGSVGGIYMSPASMHIRSRKSQASVRTVSLTPPDVSTNYIMNFIIDDLVEGSVNGFTCVDALGETVRCFLEVVGFIADYPASSAVLDLTGHNSYAPCTHCSFHFNRWSHSSKFAYTTSITSRNSSYRRTQQRTESIRSAGLTKEQAKCLGMSLGDESLLQWDGMCPLLKFCSALNARLSISPAPTNTHCHALDGYSLNIIAPDHLITGLMKGVLLCSFIQLDDDFCRLRVQLLLRECLLDFGFQSQSLFYNKKKLVPGLSMSMIYGIFTVLPAVLESLGYLSKLPTRALILHLHRFICVAFWWPRADSDGIQAWRFVHGEDKTDYHNTLHTIASNFVKAVNKYAKQHPTLGKYVDRPNTHRLLELTAHTIPLFSHVYFVCELVFESSHQPLKFFLSRNYSSGSHMQSVYMILAKDWLIRLWSLWSIANSEKTEPATKETAMMGMLRFLCGPTFDLLDWLSPDLLETKTKMKDHVKKVMRGKVEERLQRWYSNTSLDNSSTGAWCSKGPFDISKVSLSQRSFLLNAMHKLQTLLGISASRTTVSAAAIFKRGYGSNSFNSHERISIGDVVQVLNSKPNAHSPFITASTDGSGCPFFYIVGGIVSISFGPLWIIVMQCDVGASPTPQVPNYNDPLFIRATLPSFYEARSGFQFLELGANVKKVGVIHDCAHVSECIYGEAGKVVSHSCSSTDGGRFFLLPRFLSYPPRRS